MTANNIFGRILLSLLLVFLIATSFFMSVSSDFDGWIPITAGLIENDISFNAVWSVLLSCCFMSLIVGIIVFFVEEHTDYSFNFVYCITLALIIILSDPKALFFNQIYVVSLFLLLSLYFMVKESLFWGAFLCSVATLFYAPIMWSLPFFLVFRIFKTQDYLRDSVKIIGGFIVPFIYIISFRFIWFDDVYEFITKYSEQVININDEFLFTNVVYSFMIIIIAIVAIHAIFSSLKVINKKTLLADKMIRTDMEYMLFTSILFLFFSHGHQAPLSILVAPYIAVLFSFYFSLNNDKYSTRVEMILFVCAIVLTRVSYFIQ